MKINARKCKERLLRYDILAEKYFFFFGYGTLPKTKEEVLRKKLCF